MKSIIFDVDGTLWDTTEIIARSWNRAISDVGGTSAVITASILKEQFGKPMDVIANNLFSDADEKQRELLLAACCDYEHEDLEKSADNFLYPHVVSTIKKLYESYSLYIVSNCQSGYIELFMKKAGIEQYIKDFECFGNTGKSKGENIKLVLERNQLEDAIYVGDTQGDCDAAAFAGVPFVYAAYGFGKVNSYHTAINEMTDLLDMEK